MNREKGKILFKQTFILTVAVYSLMLNYFFKLTPTFWGFIGYVLGMWIVLCFMYPFLGKVLK